jgi:hypothetical protein
MFQLVKTWTDDWVGMHVLRQTILSRSSIDYPSSAVAPSMSVVIPTQPHGSFGTDLSTAVPLNHAANQQQQGQQGLSKNQAHLAHGMLNHPGMAGGSGHGSTPGVPHLISNINPGFGLPPSEFHLGSGGSHSGKNGMM